MIFQDPRAHMNPVRTIGDFLTEALRTNPASRGAEADGARSTCSTRSGSRTASGGCGSTRTSCPAGMLQRVMIAPRC